MRLPSSGFSDVEVLPSILVNLAPGIRGHDTCSPTLTLRQTADALKENRKGEIRVLSEPPAFRRFTPFQERRPPAQAFRQSAHSSRSS